MSSLGSYVCSPTGLKHDCMIVQRVFTAVRKISVCRKICKVYRDEWDTFGLIECCFGCVSSIETNVGIMKYLSWSDFGIGCFSHGTEMTYGLFDAGEALHSVVYHIFCCFLDSTCLSEKSWPVLYSYYKIGPRLLRWYLRTRCARLKEFVDIRFQISDFRLSI